MRGARPPRRRPDPMPPTEPLDLSVRGVNPPQPQRQAADDNVDPLYQLHVEEVLQAIKSLWELLSQRHRKKSNAATFNEWCAKHAETLYPYLGKIAYSAPPFFFTGERTLKQYSHEESDGQSSTKSVEMETQHKGARPKHKLVTRKRSGSAEENFGKDAFLVSERSDNYLRGENAHRLVDRAFRNLNAELEKKREPTMFIIGQLHSDNLLAWLKRKPDKVPPGTLQHLQQVQAMQRNKWQSLATLPSDKERAETDLIAVHQKKGVIFIEVKGVQVCTDEGRDFAKEIKTSVDKAVKQLKTDVNIFDGLMDKSQYERKVSVTKVVAVPYLTRQDIQDARVTIDEDVKVLCKDDLSPDDVATAESKTVVNKVREWWDEIPSMPRAMELKCMQEIVGKYAGLLSTVTDFRRGNEHHQQREFRDSVRYTGKLLCLKVLSKSQQDVLVRLRGLSQSSEGRCVYFKGPPGSGKTLLLVLEARTFLASSADHHVIVLNMYRGSDGRAIGCHVYNNITSSGAFTDRVHHLEVNVSGENFSQEWFAEKIKNLVKGAGEVTDDAKTKSGTETDNVTDVKTKLGKSSGKVVDDTKSKRGGEAGRGADEALKRDIEMEAGKEGISLKNVMIVVDEIYKKEFWEEILQSFKEELKECRVLSAGLFSSNPEGFTELCLDTVHRSPPAVQNLLYYVEWDGDRKKQYERTVSSSSDIVTEALTSSGEGPKESGQTACQIAKKESFTDGPVPLCIRHESHGSVKVSNCRQCAKELARLLREKKLVQGQESQGGAAAMQAKTNPKDLKMTILVNLPRNLYSTSGSYIETSKSKYNAYMRYIASCPFIHTLQQEGIEVDVKVQLACKDLAEDRLYQQHFATWVYNFQGLEADLIVFLPGDGPRQEASQGETEGGGVGNTGRQEASDGDGGVKAGALTPEHLKHPSRHVSHETQSRLRSRKVISKVQSEDSQQASSSQVSENPELESSAHRDSPQTKDKNPGTEIPPNREIPTPGLRVDQEGESDENTFSPPRQTSSVQGAPAALSTGERRWSVTMLEWNCNDIRRFSDWDKTNILIAGSRCLSLLILIVP